MGLILKVMPSTLALYQMVGFLIEFNITNITTWLDLSFDQVKQLFKNLQNNNAQLSLAE
jgi:ABC-type sulfate transport system substrate-binding protein